MLKNTTLDTVDGGTVEFTRVGTAFDLHARDAAGHTVSTVRMSEDRALSLYQDMGILLRGVRA